MTVQDVQPVLLSHVYDDDQQLEWSAGRIESWDAALVRVETESGHVGWGEVGHGLTGTQAAKGIVEALRPQIIGRDPSEAPQIRADLYDKNIFWARGGMPTGVIGAIEVALYDAWGKQEGVPVYKLLGGGSSSVTVYGSGGIASTASERVQQAASIADQGFDIVKVRALGDPMKNVDYVESLVNNVDAQIAFDAVQGSAGNPWSVTESIRLGKKLEQFADDIYWYEEPCRAENIDGFRRVRDSVDLNVTGIESRTGRYEFRDVIDAGAVDILQPDVCIAGGFSETKMISGYAASHDIPLALHVWGTGVTLLANAHYAATDTNCNTVEYCQLPNPLREELVPDSVERDENTLHLPDDPGLGIEIPESFISEHAFVPGKGHVFD